jgi:hypothetical protein
MAGRFRQNLDLFSVTLGVLLMLAYFTIRPGDGLVLMFGFVMVVIGVAGGKLAELAIGPKGLLLKFQRELLPELLQMIEKALQPTGTLEVKEFSFTADAVIQEPKSAEEFAELVIGQIVVAPAGLASGVGRAYDATVVTSESEKKP